MSESVKVCTSEEIWLPVVVCLCVFSNIFVGVSLCMCSKLTLVPALPLGQRGELMFLTLLVSKISSPVGLLHTLQTHCQWEEMCDSSAFPRTHWSVCTCMCVCSDWGVTGVRMDVCFRAETEGENSRGISAASLNQSLCVYACVICVHACVYGFWESTRWALCCAYSRPGSSASISSTLSLSFTPTFTSVTFRLSVWSTFLSCCLLNSSCEQGQQRGEQVVNVVQVAYRCHHLLFICGGKDCFPFSFYL